MYLLNSEELFIVEDSSQAFLLACNSWANCQSVSDFLRKQIISLIILKNLKTSGRLSIKSLSIAESAALKGYLW